MDEIEKKAKDIDAPVLSFAAQLSLRQKTYYDTIVASKERGFNGGHKAEIGLFWSLCSHKIWKPESHVPSALQLGKKGVQSIRRPSATFKPKDWSQDK